MNKITLEANNKEELEKLIKENVSLAEDETYSIHEVKKPVKFLFFKAKGKYEISILKKDEITNVPEKKKEKENKKEEKIENLIKQTFEKFIEVAKLDVQIEKITINSNTIVLNLNGKDVRYLIGEKGIALNSLETLLNAIKTTRNYRIQIDSNNYKAKREETLRNLAQRKAEKVLKCKTNCKLSPMSARERKIIHEEISNYANLKTESYGEEPKRFLVIKYIEEKED